MKLLDQLASLYNQELFEEIVFLYEFTNPKSAESVIPLSLTICIN